MPGQGHETNIVYAFDNYVHTKHFRGGKMLLGNMVAMLKP